MIIGVAALSAMLPSCSPSPGERAGTLPPLSPSSTLLSTSSEPTPTNSELEINKIRATYLGFLKSYVRAQRVSAPLRRTYLARWLTEPRLSDAVKSLAYDEHHYLRTVGADRPHIIDIEQIGRQATVKDCLDRTHIYVVDSRTGNEINGSRGAAHFWVATKLKKTSTGWRVYKATHKARRCKYP